MNIFVAKLNFKTTSESLQSLFEQFGIVDSAKVITDHETGKSKGFAFVEMPNDDEAMNAIETLDNSDVDGRIIVVKKALSKEELQSQPSRRPSGESRFQRGGGEGGYKDNGYRDGGYKERNNSGGDSGYRDRTGGGGTGGFNRDNANRRGGNGGGFSRDSRFSNGNNANNNNRKSGKDSFPKNNKFGGGGRYDESSRYDDDY